ncbi:MAG: thioredoxin domain-containing protein, partial [Bacteroidota bacterium]
MSQARHTNRLIHETSPYLQQHAHNPVDWYPWGADALEKARREDKPILVSIGYSACHWCHVMEHESFEDEDVARVMNELFVCIKVDREERPDLDKIYQTSHQILAQRPGGWPLNMFLTPGDQMPFFGGTYFPRTPKYGMPGFTDLLQHVAEVYRNKRDAIREQNDSLSDIFRRMQPPGPAPGVHPGPEALEQAHAELKRQYDARFGGFGGAPKFPHPTSLELCLHRWA